MQDSLPLEEASVVPSRGELFSVMEGSSARLLAHGLQPDSGLQGR